MIVVDTNQLAYLLLGGAQTAAVRAVYDADPDWMAPMLWRSEFRSILAQYLRVKQLTLSNALEAQALAEEMMEGRELVDDSEAVLRLLAQSTCSAYDCEFVALAQELGVPLVTSDQQVLKAFPGVARSAAAFVAGSA